LISTNGLVINQHFCSGKLVEANLFFNAKPCKKAIVETTCCEKKAAAKNLETCGLNKTKKCCDDKVVLVQVDEESQTQVIDFSNLAIAFVAIIPTHLFNFNLEISTFQSKYKNYKPPLIVIEDVAVAFQIFRC
jgi:hypothetical protein